MTVNITEYTHIAVGLGTAILAFLGSFIYKKVRQESIPADWQHAGTVSELYLYPLKSGKPVRRKEVFCNNLGVKEVKKDRDSFQLMDRSFVIYTSKEREIRTLRNLPKMILVEIHPAERGIILSAPNKTDLYISMPKANNKLKIITPWGKGYGDEVFPCTDCGDSAAKWLSDFLLGKEEGLRLAYGDGLNVRNVVRAHKSFADHYTGMHKDMSGVFSDLAAILLVNQGTLDELNERLPEDDKTNVTNFRPNLVVKGPKALEEQEWRYVKIGNMVGKYCMECIRCVETTVTPDGDFHKKREPLKTLNNYNLSEGPFKSGVMGIYLRILQTGPISEGDDVYISMGLNTRDTVKNV